MTGTALLVDDHPRPDLASGLAERGLEVRHVPATGFATEDVDPAVPEDLRLLVWFGPEPGVVTGLAGLGPDRVEAVVDQQVVGAFAALRAAAVTMAPLEEREGERGLVVLVGPAVGEDDPAAGLAASALAGMTFCAARDLADRRIRVIGLREADRIGPVDGVAALILQAVDNQMLNGITVGTTGRVGATW